MRILHLLLIPVAIICSFIALTQAIILEIPALIIVSVITLAWAIYTAYTGGNRGGYAPQ